MALKIFTDGGSRGNPGPSASACIIYKDDKEFFRDAKYLGYGTNNEAEYGAVLLAYSWLMQNKTHYIDEKINFFLDSELVVKQLTGLYKIKNSNLIKLSQVIKDLQKNFQNITYNFIRREENKVADKLVNITLDSQI